MHMNTIRARMSFVCAEETVKDLQSFVFSFRITSLDGGEGQQRKKKKKTFIVAQASHVSLAHSYIQHFHLLLTIIFFPLVFFVCVFIAFIKNYGI